MKKKTIGEKLYEETTYDLLKNFTMKMETLEWRFYNRESQDTSEAEVRRGLEAQKLLSRDFYEERLDNVLIKEHEPRLQEELLNFNRPVYDRERRPLAKSMLQNPELHIDVKPTVIDERLLADRSKQLVRRFMVISDKTRGFERRAISGFGNREYTKIIEKEMDEDEQRDLRFE